MDGESSLFFCFGLQTGGSRQACIVNNKVGLLSGGLYSQGVEQDMSYRLTMLMQWVGC